MEGKLIDLKNEIEIYKFVNTHPKCMSMLYDLNLMPETTKPDNLNYIRMIAIIHLFDQIEELRETIKDALIHNMPNPCSKIILELTKEIEDGRTN